MGFGMAAEYIRAASVPWYQNYVETHPEEVAAADAQIAAARAAGYNVGTQIQPVDSVGNPVVAGKTYTYDLQAWIKTGGSIVPTLDESGGSYADPVKIASSVVASLGRGESAKEMSAPSPNNIANPILTPISIDDLDVKKVNFKFPDVFELAKQHPVATAAIVAGVLLVVL